MAIPAVVHQTHRRVVLLSPLWIFIILISVFVALVLLTLALGSVSIPLREVIQTLLGYGSEREAWTNIILKVRLPRVLTAVCAGAALGAAGLMMQTFFRNPLADPYLLGVSSGASLGVALVIMGSGAGGGLLLAGSGLAGDALLLVAAATGAMLTMVLVMVIARVVRNQTTILVLGLMLAYLTSAVVSLMIHFSVTERIQAYLNWSNGSFSGVTGSQLVWFVPAVVVGAVLALSRIKTLNALLLGDHYARSMGVDVTRARLSIILIVALLTGVVTAFCGPVAFLGVAVPHIARNLFQTADHRLLVPGCLLIGAMTALLASFIAEVPGSQLVLPLNAVMALLGAPVVMWVVLRQRQALT